jgi:selenocysteine lyase/cysteine desulfurase
VLAREKVYVSVRGTSMRVTPHVYNTEEDCARLIACLRQIAEKI